MKKKWKSYALVITPKIDIGLFPVGKGRGSLSGEFEVDEELYQRYLEARRQFELLDGELFRLLPYKVKAKMIELLSTPKPTKEGK